MAIESFSGQYRFLSNFWEQSFYVDGIQYRTMEHYFQAKKMLHPYDFESVRDAFTPGQAKRLARRLPMRHDWDNLRVGTMLHGLRHKFSDTSLRMMLDRTGNEVLIEGNTWGDTSWGVCDGVGSNMLGRCLSKVRDENRLRV